MGSGSQAPPWPLAIDSESFSLNDNGFRPGVFAAQALAHAIGGFLPISKPLVAALGLTFDFFIVAAFFALIFKVLPDVKVSWKPVCGGAVFTAALFMIGKYLLSLYLGRQATVSSYGAAGSVIVILLWVYYATLILLLGAEFTQVYAMEKGARLEPNEYAVPLTDEGRAKQGTNAIQVNERSHTLLPAAPQRSQTSTDRGLDDWFFGTLPELLVNT